MKADWLQLRTSSDGQSVQRLRTSSGQGTLRSVFVVAQLSDSTGGPDSSRSTEPPSLFVTLSGPILEPGPIPDIDEEDGRLHPTKVLSDTPTISHDAPSRTIAIFPVPFIAFPSFGRYVLLLWNGEECLAETAIYVEPKDD